MNRKQCSYLLILLFLPAIGFADSLSFQPPTTDVSVIFLGNIFGIVDGVLSGTGSQIVGQMFSVFNSALVAVAGIIVLYVVLVSTMNTAQEGEMLGRKWSSTWIPLRLVFGIGLLMPKASGYCIMQVLVMWVVVQGVGAADKVWNAALSYLNRGGVIIKAEIGGANSLNAGGGDVAWGAARILQGQVCMIGLQNQLKALRTQAMDAGLCPDKPSTTEEKILDEVCKKEVPDFTSTFNASSGEAVKTSMSMPSSGYLNVVNAGDCGTIKWAAVNINKEQNPTLSDEEVKTVDKSRSIAVQQMYVQLLPIARAMVNNDPMINGRTNNTTTPIKANLGIQQFGLAMTPSGMPCYSVLVDDQGKRECTAWGPIKKNLSTPGSVIFSGTEFQMAVAAYNGIMGPTIALQMESKEAQQTRDAKEFIKNAEAQGWMMAGSYFYQLAKLNTLGMLSSGQATDTNSDLKQSSFTTDKLTCKNNSTSDLCTLFDSYSSKNKLKQIAQLIDGTSTTQLATTQVELPNDFPAVTKGTDTLEKSLTTNGYLINSSMLVLPGQAGFAPPKFRFELPGMVSNPVKPLEEKTFHGGWFDIAGIVATLFWNFIIVNLFNMFLSMVQEIISTLIMTFLSIPLDMFGTAFNDALTILQTPNINPVIALAKMGAYYINYAMDLWITLIQMAIINILIPWFGIIILPLIMMSLPLIMSWTGVMVAVGFSTAYYVPFLPYMIFTFGSIAWIIGVIEAMVAGPIVALGVTHPEGNEVMGKSEQAIMLIFNVFLRPAMMIIGYITAIALTYVGVWVLNTGFDNAVGFVTGHDSLDAANKSMATKRLLDAPKQAATVAANVATGGAYGAADAIVGAAGGRNPLNEMTNTQAAWDNAYRSSSAGYTGWAYIYAQFFGVLLYTTMYLTIVQKAFTLITHLPDKVLRWVGGQQESLGEQASQWSQEGQKQIQEGSQATSKAGGQMQKKMYGTAMKGVDMLGGNAKKSPGSATGGGGNNLTNLS